MSRFASRNVWKSLGEEKRNQTGVRKFGTSSAARLTQKMADKMGIEFKENSYVWTLSTDTEDRYRDIIRVNGWSTDNYMRGGAPVLWAHDNTLPPIGTMLTTWKETGGKPGKNRLRGVRNFHKQTELSKDVSILVENDVLRASSVGFMPIKVENRVDREGQFVGFDFLQSDLLEDSVVPVPANPDALVGMKSMGDGFSAYREELERAIEEGPWGPRAKSVMRSAHEALQSRQYYTEAECSWDEAETEVTYVSDEPEEKAPYDDINFTPPGSVREELRRGLEWHEEGHSGDGLQPETVAWARRMANGEDITPEKAKKMRAWFARHESDKEGEGFSPGEDGYPSPGRVAWALWGGDPAVGWSNKLVEQMEAADRKDVDLEAQPIEDKIRSIVREELKTILAEREAEPEESILAIIDDQEESILAIVSDDASHDAVGGVTHEDHHC